MAIHVGSQIMIIFHILVLYGLNSVCKLKIKFIKRYYGNQFKLVSLATELNLLYGYDKLHESTFQMLQFNLKESI